jgi:hypothetical protein
MLKVEVVYNTFCSYPFVKFRLLSFGTGMMKPLLWAVHIIFVLAQGGREKKYKGLYTNVYLVKQD